MATDKGEKIQVKKIASSDLTADEISKAIEATAASSAKKSIPIAVESAEEDIKVTDTASTEKTEVKTVETTEEPASESAKIVVKRRGGFVQPPTPMGQRTDETTTVKETRASTTIDLPIKPPSETQHVVTVPESTESESKEAAVEAPQAVQPDEPTPAAESKPPEPAPPIGAPKLPDVGKNEDAQADTSASLQNPTVFDTTQYHLPIRAKSHHYVNSVVAWVVLILVLVAAAGYVLFELQIIKLSDLNLL